MSKNLFPMTENLLSRISQPHFVKEWVISPKIFGSSGPIAEMTMMLLRVVVVIHFEKLLLFTLIIQFLDG